MKRLYSQAADVAAGIGFMKHEMKRPVTRNKTLKLASLFSDSQAKVSRNSVV